MNANPIRRPLLGAAYYPEAWPESEQSHDIAMMQRAGITVVRIAEFAWHKMEPREGEYDFSWLHRCVDRLEQAGIRVILGTPSACPPIWLEEKDPEMRLLDDLDQRHQHGGRRHCCSNNPTYLRYSVKIAEEMAKEFGSHPNVIGWQIDNEIAAFEHGCYCPHCIRAFEAHLKEKYGTIENLNAQWNLDLFSQAYANFSQVPQPRPHTWHSPHLLFEWSTFHSQSHVKFIKAQADVLHRYTDRPVGTDMMPVFNQDYGKMNEFLDVVQYNHYDDEQSLKRELFWFDYMRPVKDTPFWVTETSTCWNGSTSTPSNIRIEGFCRANSWLPIVLGAEANMYWLWRQHWAGHELMHGAVLYASGRPMHTFGEVQEIADGYAKCADFLENTRVQTDFAMIASTTTDYLMKQQAVVWEPDAHQWETAYCKRLYRVYDAIAEAGIRPDVLTPMGSLDRYRILFTPFLMTLEEENMQERITAWVENGGIWLAGPMTDIRNGIGVHYRDRETGILEALTGATLVQQIPDAEHRTTAAWADGSPFLANKWLQLYEVPEDAQVMATVTGGYSALVGKALVFRKTVGKGQIWVLGTEPSREDLVRLLNLVLEETGSSHPKVSGSVAAAFRAGSRFRGICAQEYGGSSGTLTLSTPHTDLLTGQTHVGQITLHPWQTLILQETEAAE